MRYPSIEEYKAAVGISESFATLNYLKPVFDKQGFPIFIAGGPAVVFKMEDKRNTGRYYAMKCFTREQAQRKCHFEEIHQYLKKLNSPYLIDYQYLENELWVNDNEYPVLLMEWIEGETMSQKIGELCEANDKHGLARLAYDFNKMAIWLLQQDFAHGDVKPENIQVMPSADLKLLDYDGMFIPAFKGEKAPELGTAEYRHPMRTEADFNEHLDDFPLLVLALSLLSLQKRPELYEDAHQGDSLLFTTEDYNALYKCRHYAFFTQDMAEDKNISSLFGLLQYAVTIPVLQLIGLENTLTIANKKLSRSKPKKILRGFSLESALVDLGDIDIFEDEDVSELSTKVDPDEPTWTDEFGVVYSADRKKLIRANNNLTEYKIAAESFIICDEAFLDCKYLLEINIPDNINSIGKYAFKNCGKLLGVDLPCNLQKINKGTFYGCKNLMGLILPDSLMEIEDEAFYDCKNLITINFPVKLRHIGTEAFYYCENLMDFILPKNLIFIGEWSFAGCKSLGEIRLPNSLKFLKRGAFSQCKILGNVELPELLEDIEKGVFAGCERLVIEQLPIALKNIDDDAFKGCKEIRQIRLPENLAKIGSRAFQECINLTGIYFSRNLVSIGQEAFYNCINLKNVSLYEKLRSIGTRAFYGCINLSIIQLSRNIETIEDEVFNNCNRINKICVPQGTCSHFKTFSALKNLNDKLIEI